MIRELDWKSGTPLKRFDRDSLAESANEGLEEEEEVDAETLADVVLTGAAGAGWEEVGVEVEEEEEVDAETLTDVVLTGADGAG